MLSVIRQYRNSAIGAFLLILAAAYFKGSFFETSNLMVSEYGPEFMPRIYAASLAVLSILLIFKDVRSKVDSVKETDKEVTFDRDAFLRTLLTALLILLYIIAIKPVGFLISSVVYMLLQLCLISPPKHTSWIKFLLFSIITATALNYVFVTIFSLSLPTGILGF